LTTEVEDSFILAHISSILDISQTPESEFILFVVLLFVL
jgi:hypothetical protein